MVLVLRYCGLISTSRSFLDYLKGNGGHSEYISLKSMRFLKESYDVETISSQPAMDFVRLLIDDVVPAMNKLRGLLL
jgi:hypothetical protein